MLLLRGCIACRAVGGDLQSGAALIGVRLDVGSLPPRSSWLTVTGCRLGGLPVRLVLVCGGRYCLGEGFFSSSWDRVWAE